MAGLATAGLVQQTLAGSRASMWAGGSLPWLIACLAVLPIGAIQLCHYFGGPGGELPTGFIQYDQAYYMAEARKHFDGGFHLLYVLDYRMLGKLAVTQRNHALMNENACEKLRVPITIDDYMNSRMIADPIRLLDCVMRADGAAGLIMMSRKRAKEKGLITASSRSAMPSARISKAARTWSM
jgi:acetyl-CoA acetyltransferase